MKKILQVSLFLLITHFASAQKFHVGIFGGLSAYNGDLTEKIFPKKETNLAGGLSLNYEVNDQIMVRGGFTYSIVGGADRFSDKADLRLRNLSFETKIYEFSLTGEYYLLNLNDRKISPYGFAGIAIFHFDPYTADAKGNKVFLAPLSTEGQGMVGYPDRKPYSLNQFAIPFGMGLKFAVNDNLRIGLEGGMRKLFTDYLDDVSLNYVDGADLLAQRGQTAVDLSYRGDEAGDSPSYPAKNAQRGSPKSKDYYYFTGIHLTQRIGGGGGGGYHGRRGGKTGCPVNVW